MYNFSGPLALALSLKENPAGEETIKSSLNLPCCATIFRGLLLNLGRGGHETGLGIRSFQKHVPIFSFFSVLYKRTERSLRSFPFFIKEWNDLCVLFRSL